MEDQEKKELIKQYHEREVRWEEKSLNQLSFFNNLLLTLGVGFLSFAYKGDVSNGLTFAFCHVNWSLTWTAFSIVFIILSIMTGLLVTVSRLYDFRLTRQIAQIRRRILKHSSAMLDESSPEEFDWLRRVILPFQLIIETPEITMEDCKKFGENKDAIKNQFRNLRNITHNLGINSWRKTLSQTFFFFLSIICYLCALFVK